MSTEPEGAIYIEELARRIDRSKSTIYQWVQGGVLPEDLQPERQGGRQKLFWRPDQVEPFRAWADERASRWRGRSAS